MKRTNAAPLGEILHDFFKDNPQFRQKIVEVRIQRAWSDVLGPMIMHSTQKLFVKNRVLHVSLNSSVLRNELSMSKMR